MSLENKITGYGVPNTKCPTNKVNPQLCTLSLSAQGWQLALRLNRDHGSLFFARKRSTEYRGNMEGFLSGQALSPAVEADCIIYNDE